MKNNLYKAALVAALGLAGATAAHAQINNNDLVLGFTSTSATSDYILNLGQLLGTGAHQITTLPNDVGNVYNDSTFTTDLGTAVTGGNASAGVFGANAGSTGDIIQSALSLPATGTYNNEHQGAGFPASVSLGSVAQSGQSVHDNISTAPGQNGANASSMALYVGSPLETITPTEGTGGSVMDLEVYESTFTAGFPSGTAHAYTDQGFVSILFGSNGGISGLAWDEAATPTAVPEPGAYGIFAGAGLLLLGLRRQFTGKIA